MHTYFMFMFKHYCRPMRVNIQSCVPINTSVVNIHRLTYGEPDLTCTSLLRCLMVSSLSLISSSTELFSLGVKHKRHEYLANKRKACRPGSPISSSQLPPLACPWTSTISSPWTIISEITTPQYTIVRTSAVTVGGCDLIRSGERVKFMVCIRKWIYAWQGGASKCRSAFLVQCLEEGRSK